MNTNGSEIETFKALFWDADLSKLDIETHQQYIIERVLEYGDNDAARWIFERYRLKVILDVLNSSRALSPKSANFWNLVLKKYVKNHKVA